LRCRSYINSGHILASARACLPAPHAQACAHARGSAYQRGLRWACGKDGQEEPRNILPPRTGSLRGTYRCTAKVTRAYAATTTLLRIASHAAFRPGVGIIVARFMGRGQTARMAGHRGDLSCLANAGIGATPHASCSPITRAACERLCLATVGHRSRAGGASCTHARVPHSCHSHSTYTYHAVPRLPPVGVRAFRARAAPLASTSVHCMGVSLAYASDRADATHFKRDIASVRGERTSTVSPGELANCLFFRPQPRSRTSGKPHRDALLGRAHYAGIA